MWDYWSQTIVSCAPKIFSVLLIVFITLLIAFYCRKLTRKIFIAQKNRRILVKYITRMFTSVIVTVGFLTALATAGVNVSALLASLGLLGFSLGLAFKDFLANMLSGMMILIHQPFKVGDKIEGFQFKGEIKDINLRYTILVTDDSARMLLPNQNLVNAIVTVFPAVESERQIKS